MSLRFDADQASRELQASDPALSHVIVAAGPYTVEPDDDIDILASLLKSVISQQLSTKAASTIHGRFLSAFAGSPSAEQLMEVEDAELRALGVSGPKVRTIRGLAQARVEGRLPSTSELHELSDSQVIELLTQLHGIGEWTAHMIMIFSLGRPDVIAHGDLGVRKGMQRVDGLVTTPSSAQLLQRAEIWRPWRSVASWYLWRSLELPSMDA